jgi:hypothetical protein
VIKRIIAIILITVFIHGCATKLPPKVPVPKDAKVGVMLLIDEKPKHIYVGTTIFSNFEKDNVSNWDVKSRLTKYLKSELSRYKVTFIKPSTKLLNNRLEFISYGWDTLNFNKELAEEISSVTKSSNIDFLVTIEPYSAPVEYNSAVHTDGYGLFTRCMFGICRAEALSHVTSRVYAMNPPRLVSWSAAPKKQLSVDIASFDDLKNLAITEIDKAKDPFILFMYSEISSALVRADLKQ